VTIESPSVETAIYRFQPGDAAAVDTDGDGLADGAETQVVTDPANPDTDGDGRPDGDEVVTRIVITNPLTTDSDGAGVDVGAELVAGTNLSDPSDRP
jgi:hypothetical protein